MPTSVRALVFVGHSPCSSCERNCFQKKLCHPTSRLTDLREQRRAHLHQFVRDLLGAFQKNITTTSSPDLYMRSARWSVALCAVCGPCAVAPRSRSRLEVLIRSVRTGLPSSGSSSVGLSARQKHGGERAATERRQEWGLGRGRNEERVAGLASTVAG